VPKVRPGATVVLRLGAAGDRSRRADPVLPCDSNVRT
jgi:hypothetical protein